MSIGVFLNKIFKLDSYGSIKDLEGRFVDCYGRWLCDLFDVGDEVVEYVLKFCFWRC